MAASTSSATDRVGGAPLGAAGDARASEEAARERAPGAAHLGADHLVMSTAGRRWACATEQVLEVVPTSPATRLPGAAAHVLGLVNLRGGVLTVVDLAARLAAEGALGAEIPLGARDDGVIVVARAGSRRLGIAVDDVDDVRTLVPQARTPTAGAAQGRAAQRIVRAAARVRAEAEEADAVIGVIDVEALVRETLGLELDIQREQRL